MAGRPEPQRDEPLDFSPPRWVLAIAYAIIWASMLAMVASVAILLVRWGDRGIEAIQKATEW